MLTAERLYVSERCGTREVSVPLFFLSNLKKKLFDMEIIYHFLDYNLNEITVHHLELPQGRNADEIKKIYPLAITRQFHNVAAWYIEIV